MDSIKHECNDTILYNGNNEFRLVTTCRFVLPLDSVEALSSNQFELFKT
jgi:hypothetical protein